MTRHDVRLSCGSIVGKSLWGVARVRTLPKLGASLTRALGNILSFGILSQSRIVARIDVWSYGTSVVLRKAVPASMYGEINRAGTRTPKRLKRKPASPGLLSASGGAAFHGGAT